MHETDKVAQKVINRNTYSVSGTAHGFAAIVWKIPFVFQASRTVLRQKCGRYHLFSRYRARFCGKNVEGTISFPGIARGFTVIAWKVDVRQKHQNIQK